MLFNLILLKSVECGAHTARCTRSGGGGEGMPRFRSVQQHKPKGKVAAAGLLPMETGPCVIFGMCVPVVNNPKVFPL